MTPPAEKTKTQGQNSSKKLKEKTQPLGGLCLPCAKLKKKTKIHKKISSKLKIFKGVALFMPFLLTNIKKNRRICNDIVKILRFFEKNIIISLKLKRKTQNSRKKLKTQEKNSTSRRTCPLPPSQVVLKKSLVLLDQAFFITLAAEKTKTQGKNSSQKLKKKTQA